MVCKEEVLQWFKDLDSYKRIDVMYQLLNMCLPFEIRFLGSCIEEMGKHNFHELRGSTLTANDLEKLSKDVSLNQGIFEETVRHRVLIYLSLLSSRNYGVASWLYKKLLRTEAIEDYVVKGQVKDEMLHTEFLLLYTMALYHPAFTFEQKQFFSKIVMDLNDIRDRVSKHIALGYPPGFGYPTQKVYPHIQLKTASAATGEPLPTFQQPPGLPPVPPVPFVDFVMPMWSRPGFPCGAPEIPQFSNTLSPLVSQTASPNQSRSTSPHRTTAAGIPPNPLSRIQLQPQQQPTPPPLLQPNAPPPPPSLCAPQPPVVNGPPLQPAQLDIIGAPQQVAMEHHPQSSLQPPMFLLPSELKMAEDSEVTKMCSLDEKEGRREIWSQPGFIKLDVKPNGIRFPPPLGNVRLVEEIQALKLDGENSLHHSNSSSNSSPTETPPGTPSNTPASTPHGPRRREKAMLNGLPPFQNTGAPLIQDTTSPPPPFSTTTVPYNFPQPFATIPHTRSMFPCYTNPAYRQNFTAPYPNFPAESFPTYTFPYQPVIYSSTLQQQRTPPGCYNCGSQTHVGNECTSQNVEEITQKKAYQLEYDSDK